MQIGELLYSSPVYRTIGVFNFRFYTNNHNPSAKMIEIYIYP